MNTTDIDAEGDDAVADWEARFAEVRERVRQALGWMVVVIDGAYGRYSQLKHDCAHY